MNGSNRSPSASKVGSGCPNVVTPNRPPGRSSRSQRDRASPGSGRKYSTSDEVSTSNDSSGSVGRVASISSTVTSCPATASRVSATITGERSAAVTRAPVSVSRTVTAPRPQARSRASSPWCTSSRPTSRAAIGWKNATPLWS
jgi:hypothetical protein